MKNTLAVNRWGASKQPFISTRCFFFFFDEDAFPKIYSLLVIACTPHRSQAQKLSGFFY